MTKLEMREKAENIRQEIVDIAKKAEEEKRQLTAEEQELINRKKEEINGLNSNIEKEERAVIKTNNDNKKEKRQQMGLLKTINSVLENRQLPENVQNEINEARAEMRKSGLSTKGQIVLRTINAGTATQGQENVPEQKTAIELALRNALVSNKMGASILSGLVGDVSIPKYSGSNVTWKGETAAADAADGEWSEVELTPKRLTAILDVSKQFLLQDSNDAETMLINDLARAIAEKLDSTLFGQGAGSADEPVGLFNEAPTGTLSAIAYKDVLDAEQAIEEKNGKDYMFIVNPKVKFALKGVQRGNGLGMVLEGNEIDGINFISSNSVVAGGLMAINPKDLVIGMWGGLDITVDPFTQAGNGCVRLVVNTYVDAKMKSDIIDKKIFS